MIMWNCMSSGLNWVLSVFTGSQRQTKCCTGMTGRIGVILQNYVVIKAKMLLRNRQSRKCHRS